MIGRLGPLRPFVLAACIGAALVAVAAGWTEDDPELTQADARRFVAEGFRAAGFKRVTILSGPVGATYRAEETGPGGVPAWRARVGLGPDERPVVVLIHRTEATAVHLDEGERRLLNDVQFARLRAYSLDDPSDRRQRRDVAGTAAAGVLVAVVVLTLVRDRRERSDVG